jgi:predicted HicB family RNase H-like nuclease
VPRRIEQPSVTLATRVPKELRRAVKVHCTERRVQVQHFVIEAIEERLAKLAGKGRR